MPSCDEERGSEYVEGCALGAACGCGPMSG
jgi:hypothetical protein